MVVVGALASGINAVAGGGSLISFPFLSLPIRIAQLDLSVDLSQRVANATNSVGLFPGSLAGAIGFSNLFKKTGGHLGALFLPTLIGSVTGAMLLISTSDSQFKKVIPILVLAATLLLFFQRKIKSMVGHGKKLNGGIALVIQFLVSVYGGYFGAGMGIMMLACFALYIDGTVHELNAIKNWLSLLINFACSIVFFVKGLVVPPVAFFLVLGSLVGGFLAARISQRFDPDKLRIAIAVYGLGMSAFFGYQAYLVN